ncbi:MAG: 2,3-bisphosphoglycerate-independent phosphoglycerate mutase [Gammaproteobacteria bacterium]|nr:2,3-bisphosphoglycerate-independent phosphoglycerate mutase [Gammaproteobacteria bacterium]
MSNITGHNNKKSMVLIVLDGWGYSEKTQHNGIYSARKPTWDRLWATCPHTLIQGSGSRVGLPHDQMGNSEVGHLNLGAGRVVFQEFTRIANTIETGEFAHNPVLTTALDQAMLNDTAVHIIGLLSPGGVHSHEKHIHAMVRMAAVHGVRHVFLHMFLDGRDTAPKSAAASLRQLEETLKKTGRGRIVSIIGRYYAMDRDNRWKRTQKAYDLMTRATGDFTAPNALAGLEAAYQRGETDEFVQAISIVPEGTEPVRILDKDVVIMMNFRADRARQITQPFVDPAFDGFRRGAWPKLADFVCLTEYKKGFAASVAFPPEPLNNVMGAYISSLGKTQLRIAETEKYAHVTFFLNGGREEPFPGEDRIMVESPKVATYDLKPEMHAPELTDKLVEAISSGRYDMIICNYANPDMVGHTGNFNAVVKAIETIDSCLGRVVAAAQQTGSELIITADHGNAEQMMDVAAGQVHTAHTMNSVPLIFVGRPAIAAEDGALSDVAPTMLYLMGLPIPGEMTGKPLLKLTG